MFIFFGTDGTGKSTHVNLLTVYLKSKGFRTKHVWIRAHHTLCFILARLFMHLGYYELVMTLNGTLVKVFNPVINKTFRKVWGLLEFLSVIPHVLFKVELPRWLGYHIVADRYVVDTIVSVSYLLRRNAFFEGYCARFMLRLIPQDSILIQMSAEIRTIIDRKGHDPLTYEFVQFQEKAYKALASFLGAIKVDTTEKNVEETFQFIISRIEDAKS